MAGIFMFVYVMIIFLCLFHEVEMSFTEYNLCAPASSPCRIDEIKPQVHGFTEVV
ncbi:Nodule Cysteine-Rich (NCR) secreted peptide [Medicago truncatula]|uniref:Nodule Cysteine-Rich (NCR) secreted peptide n=1 Tax=Medicago truncatula TaxID=3880 RepID=A0A072VUR1_MEDTR|nr:Nodule Cysteine-Rich (NCR) secreted peptide [Medicago truncatula]